MGEVVMKITKDTKIGDIIPEGFEVVSDEICFDTNYTTLDLSGVVFKKKEGKNFEWYVRKYIKEELQFIDVSVLENWIRIINVENYFNIPFEIKIGLLKFICDDLGIIWSDVIFDKMNYANFESKSDYNGILQICPNVFLKSIFK